MRLALYQPEIAQNVGATIRTAACFSAALHIIEPCGFPLDSRKMSRVALDYGALAPLTAHRSWTAFEASPERKSARLVLLTTKAETPLWAFDFRESDILLIGSESAGAPQEVHDAADARLRIPIARAARSLNMATAAAIALAEMRRQTGW